MKLVIISHTEHYKTNKGEIVGWGPTISEINHLAKDFEKIYHIAFLHTKSVPPSSLPYTASNIEFIPLKPMGGPSLIDKLRVLGSIPAVLKTVSSILDKVDVYQLRTPTGIGVFLIPYLTFCTKKKGWYKYAGNWVQKKPPLGYAIQRWFLKKQSRPVTVNGTWMEDKPHIIPFENPCLTIEERKQGKEIIETKSYTAPFTCCFVGRLEDAKGVQRIIDFLVTLKDTELIKAFHFVGDGPKLDVYKSQLKTIKIPVFFHGFLDRKAVFEIYKKSHFFLLPSSASEGFPKVIAEAMNFGCIPLVSTVSSIGQYITKEVGFPLSNLTAESLQNGFASIVSTSEKNLKLKSKKGFDVAENFTFDYYRERIKYDVLTT